MRSIGLIEALRLKGGTKSFHEALYLCCRDLFGLTRDEFNARWRPRTDADKGTLRGYMQPTSDALFDRWKECRDVSWLYSHPEYKWDSIGVSTFQTSITTMNGVTLLRKAGVQPKAIFDWGAGPGFSSMIIARNFPDSIVHYNEINPDLIAVFDWFRSHAGIKNVSVVSSPNAQYDLVQAYEIVEHIPSTQYTGVGDPLGETLGILSRCAPKSAFLHSSCWSAENRYTTLGHFLQYDVEGRLVNNSRTGLHFRRALHKRGWSVIGTGWNSRPYLFRRDG